MPIACYLPYIDVKRTDENWMMAGGGWETRGEITAFEMTDGPVKIRKLFCQQSQHL